MSLKKDIIGAEVQIGSNEAQKSLTDLAQKTATLANENDRLRISQAKLKALGKEYKEEYDKVTKSISDNSKQIKENNSQMDALRKTIGVTEMSTKQLSKRAQELRRELSGMNQSTDPERFNKLNKELIDTERQMRKNKAAIGETKAAMGALGSLIPAIGFAAIAAGIKSLVTNIVSVRKEFEKYEAVLSNTLGSHRAARTEMQMLQKFAAETPFSLQELTGAFVKLVNYGLKPSKEEMRNLGDLASSTGKGFDQLVEAVADAATGQFERLKEFGIKARKEGDNIAFTFKGQTTIIDNNAESIKKYLVGLGEMQGVAGSMSAIAGTLGGKISNMGDAWDNLMNTMGAGSSGIMVTVITWLTDLVNMFDGAFKSIVQIKEAVRDQSITDAMNSAIVEIETISSRLQKNGMSQQDAQKRALELYKKSMNETFININASYEQATGKQKTELGNRLKLMKGEYDAVKEHYAALSKIVINQGSTTNGSDTKKTPISPRDTSTLDPLPLRQLTQDEIVFASRKRSQEEWTKFLNDQIDEQLRIQKQALAEEEAIENARAELKSVTIDAVGQVAGALSDMFEKGSAAQIAFLAIEKAAAIAQIIFQTGIANAKAVAASPLTFGQPWVTINNVSAGASIAAIVAQTISSVSKKGKQSGGYSDSGYDSEPDGIYHKNEFIASAPAVRNPSVRPVLDMIDLAQRNGTISSLNLTQMFSGRQSGGYATQSSNQPVLQAPGIDNETANRLANALERFERKKLVVYTELIRNDLKTLNEIEQNRGM